MKRITIIFCFVIISIRLFAQDIYINFTGAGISSVVDNVKIENLTNQSSVIIKGNDILQLVGYNSGTKETEIKKNAIKIFPFPIKEKSIIEFDAISSGKVTIDIFDINGKKVVGVQKFLTSGNQSFTIEGLKRGIYFLKIYSSNFNYTSKLISTCIFESKTAISYNGNREIFKETVFDKSVKNEFKLKYNKGDFLKFSGYAGKNTFIFNYVPDQSTTVEIPFIECRDADGNCYPVVKIGTQLWMGENLKTTKYSDSTKITNTTNEEFWESFIGEGFCNYNNDESIADHYGRLYGWSAVITRKVCPIGWHVPTYEEWTYLTDYLISNDYNYDGTTSGNKIAKSLASYKEWAQSSNKGAIGNIDFAEYNNKTGFSALPSGYIDSTFSDLGLKGYWWTSTKSSNLWAYAQYLEFDNSTFVSTESTINNALSVRCIKDNPFVVTTDSISNIETHSAFLSGDISFEGGITIIDKGLCWNNVGNPTIFDNRSYSGPGFGGFYAILNNLSSETKYFVRAYAITDSDTIYGNEVSFQTECEFLIDDYTGVMYCKEDWGGGEFYEYTVTSIRDPDYRGKGIGLIITGLYDGRDISTVNAYIDTENFSFNIPNQKVISDGTIIDFPAEYGALYFENCLGNVNSCDKAIRFSTEISCDLGYFGEASYTLISTKN